MIQPLNDRLVVRRLKEPSGLITLITSEKPAQNKGIVEAVGPGKWDHRGRRVPLKVKPGDVIYYGRYWDAEEDGCVLIQEADIIGLVEA